MTLVYPEWTDRSQVRISKEPISEWSTTRVMGCWRTHADNRAFLEFMAREGNFQEKGQARKELVIADRKLAFWKKHPNWDAGEAERHLVRLRTDWSRTPPHPPKTEED